MTQVYTRSVTTYFPNGLSTNQLMTEINAVITPSVISINVQGDCVNFIFLSAIASDAVLDTVLNAHIPQANTYAVPYIVNSVMANTIGTTQYKYYGGNPLEITISQTTQSQYTSITAAIAANNTPNNVYVVFPGTYIENNPIALPAGSSLRATGTAANTIVVAQNSGSDLITLNQKCHILGFTFDGAYGTGARGVYFDATLSGGKGLFSVIEECFFTDCNIGLECDGKNYVGVVDTLFCDKVIVQSATVALAKGIYCHSGAQYISTTGYVVGVPSYYPIAIGYHCTDPGSKISLITGSAWFCGTGLELDNGCTSELSLLSLNYNTIASQVGSTGTTTKFSANSLAILNSTQYDISILPTNANVDIYSSYIDDSKLNNPNNVNINIKYNATNYGSYYQAIIGDLQIGSANQPSKTGLGEGLYVNNGIHVFSNTNLTTGTWLDNTTGALSLATPSFNLFPTGAVGECMFIGSIYDIFGFKVNIITATTSVAQLDDVVWEYWNGTVWTQFYAMQTYPTYPCHTYIDSFVSVVSEFNIRFGLTANSTFAQLTLNGQTSKWVRFRIVNALASVPIGEYIQVHTNSTIIDDDGYMEFFGNSRIAKNLEITNIYSSNSTPGSNEIFISQNLSSAVTNNVFTINNLVRVGFIVRMQVDIDISFPIKLNLAFIGDNSSSGNVCWTVRYGYTAAGYSLFLSSGAAPSSGTNQQSVQNIYSVTSGQNNVDLRTTISIDVHNIPSNPSSSDKNILFIALERNAQSGNGTDTYPGNVYLMTMDTTYVSWTNGGHLTGF